MSIYDEMQSVAREILGDPEFKQGSTQLVKKTPGSGPVDDPGPTIEVPHDIDGAVRGVQWKFVDSGMAVGSDLQITHAVLPGIVPTVEDHVLIDGRKHVIKQVIAKPSAGTPVAYTLILER